MFKNLKINKKLGKFFTFGLATIFFFMFNGCFDIEQYIPPAKMSVWVWSPYSENIANKEKDREKFFNICFKYGVSAIHYDEHTTNKNALANFIEEANKKGIEVLALYGSNEGIERFLEFQKEHKNSSFYAFHLDYEPPKYNEKYDINFLKYLSNVKENLGNNNLWVDIPCNLNEKIKFNNTTKEIYKHVIDILDENDVMVLMAYRDYAREKTINNNTRKDGIIPLSEDEVSYAEKHRKRVVIGVKIDPAKNQDEEYTTFNEEGITYMYEVLREVKDYYGNSIEGFSIHKYSALK